MADADELWKEAVHRALVAAMLADTDYDTMTATLQRISSPLWVPPRRGYNMPSMWNIARYWHERGEWFAVDLERPACFACEVPGAVQDGPLPGRWNGSIGRLERGHLVNRIRDGLDYAPNLVPLCAFCNRNMPVFNPEEAQDAIDWVLSGGATARLAEYIGKYGDGDQS